MDSGLDGRAHGAVEWIIATAVVGEGDGGAAELVE